MMSETSEHKGDFARDVRLLRISVIAAVGGVLSTVAAYFLLHLIRLFTNLFFFQTLSTANQSPSRNTLGLIVIAAPVIGGLIVGLIARFGSEQIRGHGIPEAIEAILFGKSKMSPKVAILKPLASAIAIGSGGPFGAEGPIIMTGGAIGSLVAQYFHLSSAERKALLVAGAVAGMTAVFGTPVAAVLLAIELLLFELRPRSLLPVAIACAVAGFTRPLLLGSGPLFPLHTIPLGPIGIVSSAIAGLIAGALSWGLSTWLYKVEDLFGRLPIHWMWWPALGAVAVGVGGYCQPRTLGVGYDVIGDMLQNHLAVQAVIAIVLVKAVIWVIALASGTSGGVLAPLLMMGAGVGALAAPYMPGGEPAVWPLIFMAATLGGMMRAPVMAAVFAFELTGDANALLPLLAAAAVAYGFTVLVMRRSILTEKIARRGYHIYREYSIDPLERHFVDEVMTRTVETIDANKTVTDVLRDYFGSRQKYRAYPVVAAGVLVGMADRAMLDRIPAEKTDSPLGAFFAQARPDIALPGETCRNVAARLAITGLDRVPVVEDEKTFRLLGIVSRHDLVKPSLSVFTEERELEQLRRVWVPRSTRFAPTNRRQDEPKEHVDVGH
ncbi:Cl- channel voltage-gated family protein [Paraburkholderia hospita]|uniref:Cl-channel voltage-gated family protein n=1 Tax=Paraburkholderia hospita TaxID=169430 RepID=A0ABP2P8A7_9BURK|nr:chloride channel protein [Paraburkholderia hospita]EIM93868.1 Cl- channel voltage-gated family protein [Paraburkholderia hospita]OUL80599.1 chloride channel protein [Paraburkholderia hospita]